MKLAYTVFVMVAIVALVPLAIVVATTLTSLSGLNQDITSAIYTMGNEAKSTSGKIN